MSDGAFFPITPGQIGGAIAIDVFVALANLALIPVAVRLGWLAISRPWSKTLSQPSEYVFFHTQLGQYVSCLIFAMLFNTFAGILGFPWVSMKGIQDGPLCRAQAFFMAIGAFSSGFFTVAIAVHTFGALVLQKRQSVMVCRSIIGSGWGLSLLIAVIPFAIHPPEGSVYGPDGLSCAIRSIFPKLLFFFHLLPILLASLFGIILYSLIFLALRGTVKIRRGIKLILNPAERWADRKENDENYHRFLAKLSRSMLWYPVAYIVFLVPYAMLRLYVISGFQVSFEAMVFAFVWWYLLNVVQVPLLYNTFRLLGKAFDCVSNGNTRKDDLESFFTSDLLHRCDTNAEDRRLAGPTPSSTVESIDLSYLLHRYDTNAEDRRLAGPTPSPTVKSIDTLSEKMIASDFSYSNPPSFIGTYPAYLGIDYDMAPAPAAMLMMPEYTHGADQNHSDEWLSLSATNSLFTREQSPSRPRPPRSFPPLDRSSSRTPDSALQPTLTASQSDASRMSPVAPPEPIYSLESFRSRLSLL